MRVVKLCLMLLLASMGVQCLADTGLTIATDKGKVMMYERSKALVIGQENYTHWTKLETVPDETARVVEALRKQGFDDIRYVMDGTGATLGKTIKSFLAEPATRDTRIIVYYAGHGETDERFTGYLVPVDNVTRDQAGFWDDLVSMEDISNWSKASKAKHILFVFDSCFSGAVFLTRNNLIPSELFIQDADQPVRQFITSGSAKQTVPARSDFVVEFIEGVAGAADIYKDGVITGNELGYWIKQKVSALGKQTPQFGSSPLLEYRKGDTLFFPATASAASGAVRYASPAGEGEKTRGAIKRSLGTPDAPNMNLFSGIEIAYYQKVADGDTVKNALDAKGIPYVKTRASLPEKYRTNTIACGPDTPVDAIKALATTLIEGGIKLEWIIPYKQPKLKPYRLEVLTVTGNLGRGMRGSSGAGISAAQINALTQCPD
ncbi:Caspase domain protein [compost metagenome]|jgi:hypothetical protein|uniref:caspase family protein n=1 Tax=Achromobacter sp. TaxID=134375 RepID=UPI000F95521A